VLEPNSVYYMRVAGSDWWGYEDLTYSSEIRIDTGDDILGGDIPWDSIVGDDKPADRATATGIASAVIDPRFDLSATAGALTGYWTTEGTGVALTINGGVDSGPGVTMTASGSTSRIYPAGNRLPGSSGARFQVTARVLRSTGMSGYVEATEFDRWGGIIGRHYVLALSSVASATWTVINCVHTIQSTWCRSVTIGLVVTDVTASGQTLSADDFDIYLLAPIINSVNAGTYIGDSSLDTRAFVPGSNFISQTVTKTPDASFTSLTVPSAPWVDTWSDWYVIGEYTMDYLGRADGQVLMLSSVDTHLLLANVNSSPVTGCDMQMQLIRTDDDTVIGTFIDTVASALTSENTEWTFTMPVTPTYWFTYSSYPEHHDPWSALHGKPGAYNLIDADPPNGLATYRLQWRLRPGAAGITGLSQLSAVGSLSVIGGKA
jgi:hypothetical protein